MPASEDGGEHLFDHFVLSDDDFLEFFLHQPTMLAELLENIGKVSRFHGAHEGDRNSGDWGLCSED
jgi:hypothetical protein